MATPSLEFGPDALACVGAVEPAAEPATGRAAPSTWQQEAL
jgi:hypothetical protein